MMTRRLLQDFGMSASLLSSFFCFTAFPGFAQTTIISDRSTGTQVNGSTTSACFSGICSITGGIAIGTSLFHSFSDFSLSTGDEAQFDNHRLGATIDRIFSRVTGGDRSTIDGLISTTSDADLFLINPNGILFGPNASLDIGGSFISSTADRILFDNGAVFAATGITPTSTFPDALLTITAPIGLQYGSNPGTIQVQGPGNNLVLDELLTLRPDRTNRPTGLEVSNGQTLALLGGTVRLVGGNITNATGHIEIGAVGANSQIDISPSATGWDLSYDQVEQFEPIRFAQAASADTSGGGGGSIHLQGAQVTLTDGSALLANTLEDSNGVGIVLNATERLTIRDSSETIASGVYSDVMPDATGNGGDITITTDRLQLINGGQVSASTFSNGNSGNINISAHSIRAFGRSAVDGFGSGVLSQGNLGQGGTIDVESHRVSVEDGGYLYTLTDATGNAGDIDVRATEIVVTGTLGIENGFQPSFIASLVAPPATGNGGSLTLIAEQLQVRNGAEISSTTFGFGDAGDLRIQADSVEMGGLTPDQLASSLIVATANFGSTGKGGTLFIQADSLVLQDGSQVGTSTEGAGQGGDLTIEVGDIHLQGSAPEARSGLFASALVSTGAGGNIVVEGDRLLIQDGATINVSNFPSRGPDIPGQGAAGSITLDIPLIQIGNNGVVIADTLEGDQGNVTIRSDLLVLNRRSRLSTNAGSADGGNIDINAGAIAALNNSDITANAEAGFGGQVLINTDGLFGTAFRSGLTPNSDITASSDLGSSFSGEVVINTPDVDPSRGLVDLPNTLVDVSNQVTAACEQIDENTLVVAGAGGIPQDPYQIIHPQSIWTDVRLGEDLNNENRHFSGQQYDTDSSVIGSEDVFSVQVQEAQSWWVNSQGNLVLSASSSGVRSPQGLGCVLLK